MARSSKDSPSVPYVRDFNDVAALVAEGVVWGVGVAAADTGITGQTSYAATLATLHCRNIGPKAMVPLYALFSQTGTVAGGRITIHVSSLQTDQYTSGTAITPFNLNRKVPGAGQVVVAHTATLPAFTTGNQQILQELDVFQSVSAVTEGAQINAVPFPGAYVINPNGAFTIYSDATITAPTWFFHVAWAEISL